MPIITERLDGAATAYKRLDLTEEQTKVLTHVCFQLLLSIATNKEPLSKTRRLEMDKTYKQIMPIFKELCARKQCELGNQKLATREG